MSEEKEQVGSVAEEAAKLLHTLQDWARESSHESATAGAASTFAAFGEHIATGGDDCKYCPVCQLIAGVRKASPEVRQHLTTAASSLFQAAAAGLVTSGKSDRASGRGRVEKIDLEDDA